MGQQVSSPGMAHRGLWLVCLMGLVALACTKAETPPTMVADDNPARPTDPPNIILISLDTVRADHLAVYGYEVPNTPSLATFAQQATLWSQAYSTAPWTLPAHASMLTGQYPFAHGAHTFRIERPGRNVSPLDLEVTTMTEVLQQQGYRTGAFVANKHFLSERFQVNQGFDRFKVFKGRDMATSMDVNSAAMAWLEEPSEQPYFLFLNYMDAHRPYRSTERPGLFDFPVSGDSPRILSRLMEPILSRSGEDHTEELHSLRAQYDTAIANLDEDLGDLFAYLAEREDFDDALIIITSDHGEYFGEHDLLEHSKDVYQEALHVPMIVKVPRQQKAQRKEAPVSVAAIPALVMQSLPLALAETVDAALPAIAIDAPVLAENHYSRARDLFNRPWGDRFHRVRRVIYLDGWKYIHGSDGSEELYLLADDPRVQKNLMSSQAERGASMRAMLEEQLTGIREATLGDSPEYSEEELNILDQLGY